MKSRFIRIMIMTSVYLCSGAAPGAAWDGTDAESGAEVEIEQGNLVREGRDIEVYDYDAGEHRDVTVENIERNGSSIDIEVYDNESGEYRTFEMEDE